MAVSRRRGVGPTFAHVCARGGRLAQVAKPPPTTKGPRVRELGHVGLFVRDMVKMRDWYRDTLGLTVTDGDPERIIFMVLKLGYPASSVWHYPDYKEANDRIRSHGNIAHRIYPGFRDDPPQAGPRTRRPKR